MYVLHIHLKQHEIIIIIKSNNKKHTNDQILDTNKNNKTRNNSHTKTYFKKQKLKTQACHKTTQETCISRGVLQRGPCVMYVLHIHLK